MEFADLCFTGGEQLQDPLERGAQRACGQFAGERLAFLRGKRPAVRVFPREDASVDGDRKADGHRALGAFLLLFKELREVPDDKLHTGSDALGGRAAPKLRSQRSVGRNADPCGVVLGVVLPVLRGGLEDQGAVEKEGLHFLQRWLGLEQAVGELETGVAVKVETADARLQSLAPLGAGGKNVGDPRRFARSGERGQKQRGKGQDAGEGEAGASRHGRGQAGA